MSKDGLCPHGMAGYCEDCPDPAGRWTPGETMGVPTARVRYRRLANEVWRTKADGSYELVTAHWTRRGAERARDEYLRTGRVVGRPM